jgi:xylan 1,4-beta-xylosidase
MNLSILAESVAPSLRRPWKNAIAVGRAYELLREDVLEHLRFVQREIGFSYCRFHGLFHDEMAVVGRRDDGSLAFRWHQVDKVYDALLKIGLRPFVELNPMPTAMASGIETIFDWKMNVTPPREYGEWEHLIEAFARHLVDRYGPEEVEKWYFEVWNEPNLPGFWSGTKEEYWLLYEASARAVKRVSPTLRIGGPASSKANWISDIIAHTQVKGIPLDFISTHLYPQDEYVTYIDRKGSPHEPGRYFADTVRQVQKEVRGSAWPHLEIHWTEWNTLSTDSTVNVTWVDNTSVAGLFGAAVVCDTCLAVDDACDTLCWWVASDIFEECGMPQAEFTCTYGLVTINGLPKATFHAFEFINRMRGRVLGTKCDMKLPQGCGSLATCAGDSLRILLWHRVIPEVGQKPWSGQIQLPSYSGPFVAIESRIAAGQGSAWETWKQLGSPQTLSPEEMRLLRVASTPACRLVPPEEMKADSWNFSLAPGEVCLLERHGRGAPALPKVELRMQLDEWEKKMSAQSKQ